MKKTPVEEHFDSIAGRYDRYTSRRDLHYSTLKNLLNKLIGKRKRVLEIGCGTGDLLAAISPAYGLGYDLSGEMIKIASRKYKSKKNLKFTNKFPKEKFDYIFMSDVIEHLEDRGAMFNKISDLMTSKSVFVNTMMNPVWEPIESLYSFLGLKMPEGPHERIGNGDIKKLARESDLKIINHDYTLLMPIKIPFYKFINKYLGPKLKKLSFIEYFVFAKV